MAEIFIKDPTEYIRQQVARMQAMQGPTLPEIDPRELADREEAARAYAGEDEQHFVKYGEACIDNSIEAMRDIRQQQNELWRVFNEEPPDNFAKKEPWQSKVVFPKPFGAVMFASAIVRKAFDVQFLSIRNERDKVAAHFWQELMDLQLSQGFADFPIQFTDATTMSFAVGQSMEMIPVWRTGRGLRYVLVEPWKIHRDPDAQSRQPHSGLYWIHQEYLDYHLLRKWQKDGSVVNLGDFSLGTRTRAQDEKDLSLEAIYTRKGHVYHRNDYRTMILTSEFWGTVIDKRGNILLPNCTYTFAAGRVIKPPKASRYPTLRWPGVGFTPLPHPLRFDGRGLLHGVKSLWNFMCSLLCLHNDSLNWQVNPPTEIDTTALVEPTDLDDYPGKQWLTKGTVTGHQAVRPLERRQGTSEFLANMNFGNMTFDEASFVSSVIKGLPGYRAEVTARESAQNLDQGMTVFSLMGKNLEHGALQAIRAGVETVLINLTLPELQQWLGPEVAAAYFDPSSPTKLSLPKLTTGGFHVSGISAVMQDWEVIRNIREIILPLCQPGSVFLPYFRPYYIAKALETRLNLTDEKILVDEAQAMVLDQEQQAQQEAAIGNEAAMEEAAAIQAQNEAALAGVEGAVQ